MAKYSLLHFEQTLQISAVQNVDFESYFGCGCGEEEWLGSQVCGYLLLSMLYSRSEEEEGSECFCPGRSHMERGIEICGGRCFESHVCL